jgi:hypothetical protein
MAVEGRLWEMFKRRRRWDGRWDVSGVVSRVEAPVVSEDEDCDDTVGTE